MPNMQSLSQPMVESDSASEDELINSIGSVEYNIDSSIDSGTDSDDNYTARMLSIATKEALVNH